MIIEVFFIIVLLLVGFYFWLVTYNKRKLNKLKEEYEKTKDLGRPKELSRDLAKAAGVRGSAGGFEKDFVREHLDETTASISGQPDVQVGATDIPKCDSTDSEPACGDNEGIKPGNKKGNRKPIFRRRK